MRVASRWLLLAALIVCGDVAKRACADQPAPGYLAQTAAEPVEGLEFRLNDPGVTLEGASPPTGGGSWYEDPGTHTGWTVWAGAIFLTRSQPRSESLVGGQSGTVLNADQFTFNLVAGPDLNAIRHGEDFDVDFRYFQVNQIRASRSLFPGEGVELLTFDPIDLGDGIIEATYVTSLQSVEANFRQNVTSRLSLLAGFRYLSLRDDFGVTFDLFNDSFGRISAHTNGINRLYGFQIGADAIVLQAGRVRLQNALKAGVYGNNAQNALRIGIFDEFEISTGKTRQHTSFVGDWNFTGAYQFSDHFALKAGYQLLWLSGVALASEQLPTLSDVIFNGMRVNTSGDVIFHGALVSFEASW